MPEAITITQNESSALSTENEEMLAAMAGESEEPAELLAGKYKSVVMGCKPSSMALATRITISDGDPKNPCHGRRFARIGLGWLISASRRRHAFPWAAPAKLQ